MKLKQRLLPFGGGGLLTCSAWQKQRLVRLDPEYLLSLRHAQPLDLSAEQRLRQTDDEERLVCSNQ